MTIRTNGDDKLHITTSGNVGIGTTSPNSKLAVVGLSVYANNAGAIAGGFVVGDFTGLVVILILFVWFIKELFMQKIRIFGKK